MFTNQSSKLDYPAAPGFDRLLNNRKSEFRPLILLVQEYIKLYELDIVVAVRVENLAQVTDFCVFPVREYSECGNYTFSSSYIPSNPHNGVRAKELFKEIINECQAIGYTDLDTIYEVFNIDVSFPEFAFPFNQTETYKKWLQFLLDTKYNKIGLDVAYDFGSWLHLEDIFEWLEGIVAQKPINF